MARELARSKSWQANGDQLAPAFLSCTNIHGAEMPDSLSRDRQLKELAESANAEEASDLKARASEKRGEPAPFQALTTS